MPPTGGISNIRVFCEAKSKRSQEKCRGAAVKGSVPPRCRMHISNGKKNAVARYETEVIAKRADKFAGPVPITAADALSADIDRSNGLIVYYEGLLDQQEDNVVRAMLNAERAHSHKLTTTALAQKVDEKRAVIFESTVDKIAQIIEDVVSDLGHDPHTEYVRQIIAEAISRFTVRPDDVISAETVEPWEAEYEVWAEARGNVGPLSALEWDGEE